MQTKWGSNSDISYTEAVRRPVYLRIHFVSASM